MDHPIRLIINADDLGAGDPTDRGIIEAFTDGVVTNASILANGPSFDAAIKIAQTVDLPLGVHLNLSEGSSLTGPITGLTDQEGHFLGKQLSRKQFLSDALDIPATQREMVAQINKVRRAGLQPDHLDTHQHCGLFPAITTALLNAAKETGIGSMRLPMPPKTAGDDLPAPLCDEMQLYRQLAPAMSAKLKDAGIRTPDGLLGMPLLNRLDEQSLSRLMTGLKTGTWELMVHPGYFDPHRAFSGDEREQELTALTSGAIQALIQKRKIRLINFTELPCAC
jgi:predicted glycoside hydrolase/deacetylase ChbG (UPF0249 family)